MLKRFAISSLKSHSIIDSFLIERAEIVSESSFMLISSKTNLRIVSSLRNLMDDN